MIRIRLHALPQDNADAVAELGKVFEILEDSGDVTPRKNSTSKLRLRYLTLAFLDAED
ncbi:hypothetical protein [Actinospica robiniae]|uniref:hypothetical protein n=1 Tax=Actinospica robiniae TaxID=304901 RepID=UPI0004244182|nr:hypothetical protein [Actinospica robiniae]